MSLVVNNLPTNARDIREVEGQEDSLEESIAAHSGILNWRILWTEELGGLWSVGLQRVRHD